MKIEISKEDFEFLKDLQHELNTQPNDGNADPVFWGVLESEEVGVPDGCGDPYITYDDGKWSLEEAVQAVEEYLAEENNEDFDDEWAEVDKRDIQSVFDFMQETLKWKNVYDVVEFRTVDKLCENTGAFLTKRACKQYIEKYKYNHCNPRTYAMTAFRNFELERLLKILKTMELKEEVEDEEPVNRLQQSYERLGFSGSADLSESFNDIFKNILGYNENTL